VPESPFPDRQERAEERHLALEGEVVAVTFQNEDAGFAVVQVHTDQGMETAAGELAPIHTGETLRLHGRWQEHPRFGRQFRVDWAERTTPTTLEGLRRYLGSGAFPGVGAEFARRLVDHYGADTLSALEAGEASLRAVPGIGPKRARALTEGFREGRDRHRVLAELRGLGLNSGQSGRLYERWQAESLARVRRDPYSLIGMLPGIGFETAEKMARQLEIPADSPVRARGVFSHLLRGGAREGHVCLPAQAMLERGESLGIPATIAAEALTELAAQGKVRIEEDAESPENKWIYLSGLWEDEVGVAAHLRRLLEAPPAALPPDPDRVLAAMRRSGFVPDESQRHAIETALRRPLAVLTGGPGTGKTTTLRLLLEIVESCGLGPALLASPTGRAAKRLQEATGRDASTLHRLLGFDPRTGGFRHDEDDPLDARWLIVDEVSMLDLPLAHALLRAVPDGCRVLLVGDADQLPSVGPGRVLRDLVESPAVPTERLARVHRQERDSDIVEAAHQILAGQVPRGAGSGEEGDFFVVLKNDAEDAAAMVELLASERIPKRYGIDPMRDLMVLSPMYRGPLGVDELNRRLGQRLNPDGEGAAWTDGLRAGDRVLAVRNDYEREIFNGDAGRIERVLRDEMLVDFGGNLQVYKPSQLGDLIPAYCVTVHRAQGSEARAVLVVLGSSHYLMLRRNLLYTAVTRGRELVVVVADPGALRRAVGNATEDQRYGRLRERLATATERAHGL